MKHALNLEPEAQDEYFEFDAFEEEAMDSFGELDEYSDHECESCAEFDPAYGESEWEAEVMRNRRFPQRPVSPPPRSQRSRLRPRVIRRFRPGLVIADPSICTCPAPNCPRHGSEYVRWVQSALNQIMNLRLSVTGIMNAATRSALRSFQQKQGLPVDGIAGPETKDALIGAKGGKSPQTGATKPAEPGMMEPASAKSAAEFDFEWETGLDQYEDSFGEFEGMPSKPVSTTTCQAYQRGEVEKSRTLKGHLPSDVIEHTRGLLIADFGVDWRTPKSSVKDDSILKKWLTTIIQVVRANPSTNIRILGFSDCVGKENNNSLLRRGRARRVYQLLYQLLGASSQWNALKSRITFIGAAPAGDYVADNSTVEGRAKNRGVLIESSRTVTFDDADVVTVTLPDTIPRIVKRGLELIQRPDQFGIRITQYQQQRIQCILMRLSQPGVDDRYLTGQGILDFMNLRNLYPNEPYYSRATQWLLPEFIVKSRQKRTDRDICNTLVRIDQDIIDGRHLINRYFHTHGAATPIRIQRLRDWVAKQQNDNRSIYSCYT